MQKKHFYLVSGEVMFRAPDDENAIGGVKLNSIISSPTPSVAAHQMGRAQQALQLRFFEKIGDPQLVVYDVFIISISYLGEMTDEEFNLPLDQIVANVAANAEPAASPFK